MQDLTDLRELLSSQFKLENFKLKQAEVFSHLLQGKSGLVVMPTGGGKSLLYQLWAAQKDARVLAISPLIALMQDQVDQAKSFGIQATCLNATVSREEKEKRLKDWQAGKVSLLFVTPERFRKPEFLEAITKQQISLLAVDEAHCISQWGHDFRPDYTKLGEIREFLGNPQTLALTATATPIVQKEILRELRIEDGFSEIDSIDRPELSLNVHEVHGTDEKIRAIAGLRHHTPGAVLIYGSLISTLYKISDELSRIGLHPLIYHGQLKGHERTQILREFQNNPDSFLLATPAFGLGINKADVRAVIHLEVPLAIEAYFQEAGRAGRDGNPAWAHLLFDPDDASIQLDFIKWANPDAGFVQMVYRLIENNFTRAAQEGANYLRDQMNFYNSRDYRVETSLNLLEKWDCLAPAQNRLGFKPVEAPSKEDLDSLRSEARLKVQNQKLLQMLEWAQDQEHCRMRNIQTYFGQPTEGKCGRCDICQKVPGS